MKAVKTTKTEARGEIIVELVMAISDNPCVRTRIYVFGLGYNQVVGSTGRCHGGGPLGSCAHVKYETSQVKPKKNVSKSHLVGGCGCSKIK